MRWAGRIALALIGIVVGAELLLQGAARLVGNRSVGTATGALTVVCVGDSHTYGAVVDAQASYPARLQVELNDAAPGRFRVINLGVPGYNTTQVLNRLPDQVLRQDAAMILVWVGINDIWNRTEVVAVEPDWQLRLDSLASRSRLYRLLRVRAHDRRIARALDAAGEGERPVLTRLDGDRWRIRVGGSVEEYESVRVDHVADEAVIARATHNYRAMAAWARGAGIPIAFLQYPVPLSAFGLINGAIEIVSDEEGVPRVATRHSIARVPAGERQLLWAAHPNESMYREIARDVARVVLESVPPPSTPSVTR